ncbi:MAG: sulfite exporter TauE/SafE family protein [Gammaproteobacteria bacterium]|nr:MAG: sulfite exporter TauE/SafE family protein [Gammaproteobacteria bacterium]
MTHWELALLVSAGVAGGWLNVMAGGGSLLTVPLMVFLGLPGPVANGTNRIAILLQNITAVATFHKRGFSDFRLSLSLSATASIGALFGAMVGVRLDGEWFDRVVALIMLGVMIIMWRGGRSRQDQNPHDGPTPRRLLLGHVLMVGAGFWGGFIQLGVGFILMPILHRVMGLDLVRTNMHKVFIITIYTVVALIVFAAQVELMWWVGAWLALGNAFGGWLGAHTTVVKGEHWIRWVLNLTLAAFIVKLLFF